MPPSLMSYGAAVYGALALHVRRYRVEWFSALGVGLLLFCTAGAFVLPPASFTHDSVVVISRDISARDAAQVLEQAHIVRSAEALSLVWRITGAGGALHPGAYRFVNAPTVFSVASRIASGAFGIPPIRITFIEGETVRDMAEHVAALFPEISASDFIASAGPYEGYLFPDTYIFPPDATAESITKTMRDTFRAKMTPYLGAIQTSGHSLHDVVVMASLIEREARSMEAKRMVSGILWNRIKKGMPLQVDAVFGYIFGRDTYSPSFADLGVDSPYNTYTHRGLPPGPIANPGLESLQAAIEPTPSPYFFYLTGTDGRMHYARTYAEQLRNQRAYLR